MDSQQQVQPSGLLLPLTSSEPAASTGSDHGPLTKSAVRVDCTGIEQSLVEPNPSHHEAGMERLVLSPDIDPARRCNCTNCLCIGSAKAITPENKPVNDMYRWSVLCRYRGCEEEVDGLYLDQSEQIPNWIMYVLSNQITRHERTHFGEPGHYHCLEAGCKTTVKKFADLGRHCTVRHCTNPPTFPCHAFGCKYGGDNGFIREDKLKSHYRNVHEGKMAPGKALQPLKPKTDGAKVTKGKSPGGHIIQTTLNTRA